MASKIFVVLSGLSSSYVGRRKKSMRPSILSVLDCLPLFPNKDCYSYETVVLFPTEICLTDVFLIKKASIRSDLYLHYTNVRR